MGNIEIREPKQQRSIEKKNKIIKAGYKLFCEKGYHNTNTAQIAKEAGVSTGIVYNYFENKKSIFLESLKVYSMDITKPLYTELVDITEIQDMEEYLNSTIDLFKEYHSASKSAHEEIMAMSHMDEDVKNFLTDLEMKTVQRLCDSLKKLGFNLSNPLEKMHIAYNLIETYCHEVIYHNDENLDYDIMKKEIVEIILNMLNMK